MMEEKKTISFFDTKPYDKVYFDEFVQNYPFELIYHEEKLNAKTAILAKGSDAVIAFVNDDIGADTIRVLDEQGVHMLAMRCAGYNNIDFKYAYSRIHVSRVPAYSPYAVAEHAMALLLTLNRKLHRAYNRTREFNFSLNGLTGFDLHGKTIGVMGTGKIGRIFMDICHGFGMHVIAYDPFPVKDSGIEYVSTSELYQKSDIISLHCPLTKESFHILNEAAFEEMKEGVFILNTSRGALVDSDALLEAIKTRKVGAAGLDVYEEEAEFFYEDFSNEIIQDDTLARLISLPNVIVTSHQAFLTKEALSNIAQTTLENVNSYFTKEIPDNEICYECSQKTASTCDRNKGLPCF